MSFLRSYRVPSLLFVACIMAVGVVIVRNGCARQRSNDELTVGDAQVRVAGDLVSIQVRDAEREELLRALARSAGFSLVQDGKLLGRVTLDLRSVPIPFALAQIVRDQRYAIHYGPGASSPERVEVGVVHGEAHAESAEDTAQQEVVEHARPTVDNPRAHAEAPTQAEPTGARGIFDATRRSQRLQDLRSDDPQQRADAIKRTPPVGTGRVQLEQALANDPDPRVRAQAAQQLGGSEGYASTHALIKAVEDDDPVVAAAAVEALVDKGDPSVCGALRAALKRDLDEDVERAVNRAIGNLEHSVRLLPESPDVVEVVPAPKGAPLPDDHGGDKPSASGT